MGITRGLKIIMLVLISFGSTSCTVGIVDKNAIIAPDDGYFILGFSPKEARVIIWAGKIVEGKFQPIASFGHRPAFMGSPEDGFILGKAPAGTLLGIADIQDAALERFAACGANRKTLVFKVDGGVVSYITTMNFNFEKSEGLFGPVPVGATPTYSQNIEAAHSFLVSHYPQMADKLQKGSYDHRPLDASTLYELSGCGK